MATWVVHLRIADYFLNKLNISEPEFVVGSIAPDCGYGEKDSPGEFDPPPAITHWSPSGMKRDCRYKDFYNEYLRDKDNTDNNYSFYLGYYIHLITDIMWSKMVYQPARDKYEKEFETNPDFLLIIKRDWNDLDFKFLNENPDFRTYRILDEQENVRDYLPYYEPNQLTVQSRFVAEYYKSKREFNREHRYLSESDIDNFIECACWLIEMEIKNKKLAQFKNKA